MSELFVPIKFTTSIRIKPSEIGINIDEIIFTKLKNNLENMCSKHGYIKQNSIKIIKRSIGKLIVSHFNGNIVYDIQCIGEICNPAQGSIIKCKVKSKNSLGLLAEGFYNNIPILQIIIPKQSAGIQSEIDIDTINIGDEIKVEVCGKKFLLYDKYISIIGKALKDKEVFIKNVIDSTDDLDEEKATDDNDNFTDINDNDFDEDIKSELIEEGNEDDGEEEDEEEEDEEEDDISIDEDFPEDDLVDDDTYEYEDD